MRSSQAYILSVVHAVIAGHLIPVILPAAQTVEEEEPPNILFAIADDWGFPHASAYGDPVVETPSFDRIASEGALAHDAYVSSPSCTPSRGAILTGQWHWRLEGAANLWSVFPDRFETYQELLRAAGYRTGMTGKGWGPGRTETEGRELAGRRFESFETFLAGLGEAQPFAFWLGTSDPHRPFRPGSGEESGMDLDAIRLPAAFPDHPDTRGDVADYHWEVQRFDALVGDALRLLDEQGLAETTIVVMTSDHGMPFPRCKSNLYDCGSRVPLAIRWPERLEAGVEIDAFVSLTDLAPTFLEAAALPRPEAMTGRSLVALLEAGNDEAAVETVVEVDGRDFVLTGKERHVPAQEAPDVGGYPGRAIRTHDFLYIRNFRPDRWPNGTPNHEQAAYSGAWYADTDNGPTKTYMIEHRDRDAEHRRLYDLSFAKRPAVELYDLRSDPDQQVNVAGDPEYEATRDELGERLMERLRATGDPRATGDGDVFDQYPYLGGAPRHPSLPRSPPGTLRPPADQP